MENTNITKTNSLQKHKKIFKCEQCNLSYTRKRHMKHHQLITHGGKRFTCPYCKLSFTRVTTMAYHIERNRRCKRADETYFNSIMGLPFVAPPHAPTTLVTAGPSTRDDYVPRVVDGHHVHPLHRSSERHGGTDAWPVPHSNYIQPAAYRRQWAGPSVLDIPSQS